MSEPAPAAAAQATAQAAAQAAELAQDWPAATLAWRAAWAASPGEPEAALGLARVLRLQQDYPGAEAALGEGLARHPRAVPLLREAVRLATARRDWPALAEAWQAVLRRRPGHAEALLGTATALRRAGQAEAASAWLETQTAAHPGLVPLQAEAASLAQSRRDWPRALRHWQAVLAVEPAQREALAGRIAALHRLDRLEEAEALLPEALAQHPEADGLLVLAGRLARARQDWPAAVARWQALLARRPQHPEGMAGLPTALHRAGRSEAAATWLDEALARHPDDPTLLAEAGRLALGRQDWLVAARHWQALAALRPQAPEPYERGAVALHRADLVPQAEALLQQGLAQVPPGSAAAFALAIAWARLPLQSNFTPPGSRKVVASRMRDLVQDWPDHPAAQAGLLQALCAVGEVEAAQAAAATLDCDPPASLELGMALAGLSRQAGDGATAIARYAVTGSAFPQAWKPWVELARTESEALLWDAAATTLAEARQRFPRQPEPCLGQLELALLRGDAAALRDGWPAALRLCEGQAKFANRLAQLQAQAAGLGVELALQGSPPEGAAAGMAAVMDRFVSLGGRGYGCEFGVVQRAFGAVTLGLLRWVAISPEGLASALEAGFAGIGDPAQTELRPPQFSGDEYMLVDRRYGMVTHTFLHRLQSTPEALLEQSCARLAYLRRRLLRQLAEGRHAFVYRLTRRNLTAAEIYRLYAALRRHGPATLLYVARSDDPALQGQVVQAAPGLLIGHLARFAIAPDGSFGQPAVEDWGALCQRAVALLDG